MLIRNSTVDRPPRSVVGKAASHMYHDLELYVVATDSLLHKPTRITERSVPQTIDCRNFVHFCCPTIQKTQTLHDISPLASKFEWTQSISDVFKRTAGGMVSNIGRRAGGGGREYVHVFST